MAMFWRNIAPLEVEISKYLKYERFFHPVRFLNLLPLSHVFGQFLGIFLPQILGGTVVFQDSFKPAEVIATIRPRAGFRAGGRAPGPAILGGKDQTGSGGCGQAGEIHPAGSVRRKANISCSGPGFFGAIHWQFGWKFWAFISGGAALDGDNRGILGTAWLCRHPGLWAYGNYFDY